MPKRDYMTLPIGDDREISRSDGYMLGRALRGQPEAIASALAQLCNTFGNTALFGQVIGEALQREHRTLQRSTVELLLGILAGLSTASTDARNEQAIEVCAEITRMVNEGELNIGMMV